MKSLKIKRGVLILFLFFMPIVVYADIACPPTNLVTAVRFLRAEGAAHIWDLLAEPFYYAGRDWQVWFTVYLPSANNVEDALQQGAEFYKFQVDFFDKPWGRESEDRQVCYYAQQESTYFVRAISLNQ